MELVMKSGPGGGCVGSICFGLFGGKQREEMVVREKRVNANHEAAWQTGERVGNKLFRGRVVSVLCCFGKEARNFSCTTTTHTFRSSKNIEGRELTYISSVLWTALPDSCVDQCLARKRLPPITLPS